MRCYSSRGPRKHDMCALRKRGSFNSLSSWMAGQNFFRGIRDYLLHGISSSLIIDLVFNSRVLHCSLHNVFGSFPSQFSAILAQLYETDLLTETSNIP